MLTSTLFDPNIVNSSRQGVSCEMVNIRNEDVHNQYSSVFKSQNKLDLTFIFPGFSMFV